MRSFYSSIVILTLVLSSQAGTKATSTQKPLMKDLVGLNGHYHYKPELYKYVGRLVRNYHTINWDVDAVGNPITIPACVNKVTWDSGVYGKWAKHDIEVNIWAVKQLYELLGDYRFRKARLKRDGYTPYTATVTLSGLTGNVRSEFAMATAPGDAKRVQVKRLDRGKVSLTITESPTYLLSKESKKMKKLSNEDSEIQIFF